MCIAADCDAEPFRAGRCRDHHAAHMRAARPHEWGQQDPDLPPGLSEHVDALARRMHVMALLGMIVTGHQASEWQLRRWAHEALRVLSGDPIPMPEGRVIRLP